MDCEQGKKHEEEASMLGKFVFEFCGEAWFEERRL